jgi:hypothetical protein
LRKSKGNDSSDSESSDRTHSSELFDFHSEVKRLKREAEERKSEKKRVAYYAAIPPLEGYESFDTNENLQEEFRVLKNQVPTNIEARILERQRRNN